MSIISDALDRAKESKKNLVIIGPAVGKSSQIEDWCKNNNLTIFELLPWPYYECERDGDEKRGIILLDHPMSYIKERKYPEWIKKMQEGSESVFREFPSLQGKIPENLFNVIVLSEYDQAEDHDLVNGKILGMLEGKDNWEIIRVNYNKESQLSFFIEKSKRTLAMIAEDKKESSIDGDIDFDRWYEEESAQINVCKRLLESPLFDTKYTNPDNGIIRGITNKNLGLIILKLVRFEDTDSFFGMAESNDISEEFIEMIVKVFPEKFSK